MNAFSSKKSTGESRVNLNKPVAKSQFSEETQRLIDMNLGKIPQKSPEEMKKVNDQSFQPQTTVNWNAQRLLVIKALQHAWKGYEKYAWGHDELTPVSKGFSNWGSRGYGLTILDTLSTAWIMNQTAIFQKAKSYVAQMNLNENIQTSVFETNIRVLGGLLSSFHLSKDALFLKKAKEVGDLLMQAIHPQSKIIYRHIHFQSKVASGSSISLAEIGTLSLEFKYLSHLTNDPKYWNAAQEISKVIFSQPIGDGFYPTLFNTETGKGFENSATLEGGTDSFYEYLIKQFYQTEKEETIFLKKWDELVLGVRKHLLGLSSPHGFIFTGSKGAFHDPLHPHTGHLACFFAGSLALSATGGKPASKVYLSNKERKDLDLAEELARSCYEMSHQIPTGLAPDGVIWNTQGDGNKLKNPHNALLYHQTVNQPDSNQENSINRLSEEDDTKTMDFRISSHYHLLRPEIIESIFILYKITGKGFNLMNRKNNVSQLGIENV